MFLKLIIQMTVVFYKIAMTQKFNGNLVENLKNQVKWNLKIAVSSVIAMILKLKINSKNQMTMEKRRRRKIKILIGCNHKQLRMFR